MTENLKKHKLNKQRFDFMYIRIEHNIDSSHRVHSV
jgi:hypothetical protein